MTSPPLRTHTANHHPPSHYEILQISSTATDDEIKRAYRSLVVELEENASAYLSYQYPQPSSSPPPQGDETYLCHGSFHFTVPHADIMGLFIHFGEFASCPFQSWSSLLPAIKKMKDDFNLQHPDENKS
eukprot:CCRYP_009937-RA/>CCRYP_009937-RA protein AED:0.06 eAED:0.09 QI:0/0/0.5/1/0/0/2/3115/128